MAPSPLAVEIEVVVEEFDMVQAVADRMVQSLLLFVGISVGSPFVC